MIQIKKRDGRMEQFMPEKIIVSAVKSGATVEDARMIAKDVQADFPNGGSTQEIRTKVLAALGKKNSAWEKNWLMYDQAVKKRSA